MEDIVLEKKPGLKRGRRATASKEFQAYATGRMDEWRERLVERLYPGVLSITAGSLLHDDIIDKLASQGKRISSATDLLTRVRWAFGMRSHEDLVPVPNEYGHELFIELQDIYQKFDQDHPTQEDTEDELDKDEDEGAGDSSNRGESKDTRTNAGSKVRLTENLVLNLNL